MAEYEETQIRLARELDQAPSETLTLWKMLLKHGVGLYTAQMICNDVMLNGVTVPKRSPQASETPHD